MLDEELEVAEPEDVAEPAPRDNESVKRTVKDATRVITFGAFVMVFAAAVIGNWSRAQDVDPMYAYDIVLRTIHFGGTYYQNGINDWGPAEPFIYHLATMITSHNGFWYGISFFIALGALLFGFVAGRTAQAFGANRDLAIAIGAAVFVHLTFSTATYAGVLYVRHITTAFLAAAWVVILFDRAWSTPTRALVAAVVTGALLGLAVQNLLTTAFTATAISLVALALIRVRRPREEHRTLDIGFVASGAVAFLSAPVWYILRGSFTEFFSGWWTYATFMSSGTGQSLGTQFSQGWDHFYIYYEQRPLTTVVILAFVAMVLLDWGGASRRERILYAGLLGWFAGSWIELTLSQRYSPNYFMVSTIATIFMIAALAGRGYRALTERRGPIAGSFAWPLLALVLAIYLSGPARFVQGMRDLSNFTSVKAHAAELAKSEGGDEREVRAVLDLVSRNGDPMLIWTNDPWPYLRYNRVSATRFIWKSFMLGEIYLGRTSTSYVLPQTWQWFRDDIAESKPVTFMNSNGGPIPPNIPFAQYVDKNFTVVYPADPNPVEYRNDVASEMLTPNVPNLWSAPAAPERADSGWHSTTGTASFRDAGGQDTDLLPISSQSCFALSGTVSSDGAAGGIVFWFDDNNHKAESVNLDWDGDHVSSASSAVEYHRMSSGVTAPGTKPEPFTLVVGRRAAALVVNGQIRAAVQLPKSVSVHLRSQRGVLDLQDLRTGSLPAYTGC